MLQKDVYLSCFPFFPDRPQMCHHQNGASDHGLSMEKKRRPRRRFEASRKIEGINGPTDRSSVWHMIFGAA